jgi:hypothetical protein
MGRYNEGNAGPLTGLRIEVTFVLSYGREVVGEKNIIEDAGDE